MLQDDVIMGTLSVRENLQFSAALRLPARMSGKERKERVEKIIRDLGLQACADTKVVHVIWWCIVLQFTVLYTCAFS